MSTVPRSPDWGALFRGWDEQQESFNPEREHRFSAMMDVLAAKLGRRFTVLDLGSGPGSFSSRILRRFPSARVVAVDYDPVVRRVGEGALGTARGRLTWVDANLGMPGWRAAIPKLGYDAAVSTTALHWLTAPQLRRLYLDLGHVIRRGGVFLNGDFLPYAARDRELARLGNEVLKARFPNRRDEMQWGAWRRWWRDARKVPALREAFAEHDRRQASHPHQAAPTVDAHLRGLRDGGFRVRSVVWQDFQNRVLLAIR
ncbi:MAG: class I SAM-dependent methyltransferase [Thermoplasmata archaeon]|nr:class I SAM-dependent methyltransferase [Thermoplasmata archaeon]